MPAQAYAYDVLIAGSVVSVLPMLVLFLVLQRYIVAGGLRAGRSRAEMAPRALGAESRPLRPRRSQA
jgi:hypothetical protein